MPAATKASSRGLGPDRAQRQRLRRSCYALGSSALLTGVAVLLHLHEVVRASTTTLCLLLAVYWTVNLAFFAVIATGAGRRLADPGMTLAQILWATAATFTLVYLLNESRHLPLIVYLLVMMFGAFRLHIGEYIGVTVTAVLLYALALVALDIRHPEQVDRARELTNWLVFFAVMVGFSLLGGEANRLRRALRLRNRELERARDRAAVASEAKTRFLATTSHELRNPLNTILGLTDVLEDAKLGERERRALERTRDAGQHLLSLINSMIDLSMLESGSLRLRLAPLDLHTELATVHAMMRPIAEASGLRLELERDPTLPRSVLGDATRLREVLVHLLGNALKFTEHGHVRLRARPQADSEASGRGPRIEFSVEDTGVGMSPDSVAQVFAPFAMADATTRRSRGGSGLGLAICRQLIGRMGGELRVRSAPGEGSCFSFAIDLPPEAVEAADGASGKAAREAPAGQVLIVDDSEDNRALLRTFLARAVRRTDEAVNGAEALDKFRRDRYDLVLLDMHMPVMDGISAVRAMRAHERENARTPTPILALTADDTLNDRARSVAAGCDDHLVKPISKKALIATVHRYLRAPAA